MTTGINDHIPRGFGADMTHGAPSLFGGLRIVSTPLAVDVHTEFRVSRCGPYDRKRKRYFVERIEIRKPGRWKAGNVLYVHPKLVEQLKQGGKPCRSDGRCQYAIDHGAEGLGACQPGKCVMEQKDNP